MCNVKITRNLEYPFQYILNKMQLYTVHLNLETALQLPATQVADSSNGAVDTVVCAPDDKWWYHPKHVEQFPGLNKLCKVATCWIYIGIF